MNPMLVNPADRPPPAGHYSHAAIGAGLVFVAGQLPVTPEGRALTGEPFDVQARQVLANVRAALEAAGSGVHRLLSVRVYLVDIALWGAFNQLYAEWADAHRPARAVVPVPALHHGLLLEVEAVALAGPDERTSP
ncbi:MAG: RidA family protein [Rubrivivax sp.]|nr:RidA family protein [Rubrivivax sp.]